MSLWIARSTTGEATTCSLVKLYAGYLLTGDQRGRHCGQRVLFASASNIGRVIDEVDEVAQTNVGVMDINC